MIDLFKYYKIPKLDLVKWGNLIWVGDDKSGVRSQLSAEIIGKCIVTKRLGEVIWYRSKVSDNKCPKGAKVKMLLSIYWYHKLKKVLIWAKKKAIGLPMTAIQGDTPRITLAPLLDSFCESRRRLGNNLFCGIIYPLWSVFIRQREDFYPFLLEWVCPSNGACGIYATFFVFPYFFGQTILFWACSMDSSHGFCFCFTSTAFPAFFF